jgi:hypothetical protein
MKKSIFLLLFIATCSNNAIVAALLQWKIEDGGNGHFYELVNVSGGITWNDAMASAELRGGYLATITSQSEQNFISNIVGDGYNYRIGGFQPPNSIEPDGNWQWITGEPFNYTNWLQEPKEPSGDGDTMVLRAESLWNDGPADYLYFGYILETPEPATLLLLGLGGFMLRKKR